MAIVHFKSLKKTPKLIIALTNHLADIILHHHLDLTALGDQKPIRPINLEKTLSISTYTADRL